MFANLLCLFLLPETSSRDFFLSPLIKARSKVFVCPHNLSRTSPITDQPNDVIGSQQMSQDFGADNGLQLKFGSFPLHMPFHASRWIPLTLRLRGAWHVIADVVEADKRIKVKESGNRPIIVRRRLIFGVTFCEKRRSLQSLVTDLTSAFGCFGKCSE